MYESGSDRTPGLWYLIGAVLVFLGTVWFEVAVWSAMVLGVGGLGGLVYGVCVRGRLGLLGWIGLGLSSVTVLIVGTVVLSGGLV